MDSPNGSRLVMLLAISCPRSRLIRESIKACFLEVEHVVAVVNKAGPMQDSGRDKGAGEGYKIRKPKPCQILPRYPYPRIPLLNEQTWAKLLIVPPSIYAKSRIVKKFICPRSWGIAPLNPGFKGVILNLFFQDSYFRLFFSLSCECLSSRTRLAAHSLHRELEKVYPHYV
jgi:hypothetical protein